PREEVAYVTCTYRSTCIEQPDFLATVDLNPRSPHYGQVIHRLPMPNLKDELHCAGWGPACGCFESGAAAKRTKLWPGAASTPMSSRKVGTRWWHRCQGWAGGCRGPVAPPRPICAPGASAGLGLGTGRGSTRGGLVPPVLSGAAPAAPQSRSSPLLPNPALSEFPLPKSRPVAADPPQEPSGEGSRSPLAPDPFPPCPAGVFGRRLNVWNLSCRSLSQCFDLGEDSLPLNVRFLHNPDAAEGYVACALSGAVFRFYKSCEANNWAVEEVIRIPPKDVSGWIMPKMPAFIADLLISPDDRFLYVSNWLHGDIRQYELSRSCKPRLVGQVFVGGSILRGGPVTVCRDEELKCQPEPLVVKCKRVYGGPAKMQLSLDGKRLYVTNSFYSTWDRQFYPSMVK
ncbi:SBP1 oxidase, partial [Pteruthius melanotis]|nr:SBP1 oxidase [Pteruthius melanotis]